MAVHAVPVKTTLGADELRGRSRTLGQRHRTVLLLVDGRRSVSEVVALAQQAGAQASHFEDLVRMGMVEIPKISGPHQVSRPKRNTTESPGSASAQSEWPTVAPPSEPEGGPEPPSPPKARRRWSLFPVGAQRARTDPSEGDPEQRSNDIGEVIPSRHPQAAPAAPAARGVPPQPEVQVPRAPPPAAVAGPRRGTQPQNVANPASRGAPDGPVPPLSIRDEVLGMAPSLAPRQAPDEGETQKLERARTLLLETLRIDSPVFGARMLLRLREATTRDDLIDMVWSIERHLAATRHSRKEMLSLHRARELLGLGNTVVPDE
jgi:hypothetical protein